MIEYNTHIKL